MQRIREKLLLYSIKTKKDPQAFAALYDAYIQKIYRFVYFKVSNVQEAEDIVSDTFLKAWRYLSGDNNKDVQSFSGLIYDMARNAVVDWYRKQAKQRTVSIEETAPLIDSLDMAQTIDTKHDSHKLIVLIRTLKHEYQEVLLLRYVDELSIKEISLLLDRNQTAIRVTMHRALKKLKEMTTIKNKEQGTKSKPNNDL